MATFIMFGKYTAKAMEGMEPGRTAKAIALMERFGGKVKSIYAMLGETDLLIIADYPGNEAAMKASLALAKATGLSFVTSPAVSVEQFDKMIAEV